MKSLDQLWDETLRDYAFYLRTNNTLLAEIYDNRCNMIFKAQYLIDEVTK
jgi:hypothetical protein